MKKINHKNQQEAIFIKIKVNDFLIIEHYFQHRHRIQRQTYQEFSNRKQNRKSSDNLSCGLRIQLFTMRPKSTKTEVDSLCQPPSQLFQSGFGERYWLRNHGKDEYISFSDQALLELRKYFNSLDQNNNGSIGVQQLEDPFIAFGLSETRQQVQQLIKSVDLDGSGQIEFNQFLEIMLKIKRGKGASSKNSAMFDFFQRMSTGKLGQQFDKDMSFKLNVSRYRRKKLLQSMMGETKQQKQKGAKILQNFKKQVLNNPGLRDTLNEAKKGNNYIYSLETKSKRKF